jgi:glucose-6-phosphate 1-epimerase
MGTLTERQLNEKVVLLDVSNAHASATISLFGGQVLSFTPHADGRERLFLSRLARLDGSKSIRGGIPVCWPWFGAHKEDRTLPAHGYVRTRPWLLLESVDTPDYTQLLLQCSDSSGTGLEGQAQLQLRIRIGQQLQLALLTTNTGTAPFPLSCALHSYFAVSNVHQTRLEGLTGDYSDKTRDWAHFATPAPYTFTEETDRIHLAPAAEVVIADGTERTVVQSSGHDSIVVWNPWTECARNFPDMEAQDYTRMLCVETALTQGYKLAPGQTQELVQQIG